MTRIVGSDDLAGLISAADRLRRGAVIAAPADSGWAILCDPFNEKAAHRVGALGSGGFPPALVVSSPVEWRRWAYAPPHPGVDDLLDEVWPGPLEIIARARRTLPAWMTSDDGTVTVAHPDRRSLNLLSVYSGLPLACAFVEKAGAGEGAAENAAETAVENLGEGSGENRAAGGFGPAAPDAVMMSPGRGADIVIKGERSGRERTTGIGTVVDLTGRRPVLVREGDVLADAVRRRIPDLDDSVTMR